jgi:hypothetical protein
MHASGHTIHGSGSCFSIPGNFEFPHVQPQWLPPAKALVFRGVLYAKNFNLLPSGAYLCINVELFKEKGMAGVVCRKSEMNSIASVNPDGSRIFPIPETGDMNVAGNRLCSKRTEWLLPELNHN